MAKNVKVQVGVSKDVKFSENKMGDLDELRARLGFVGRQGASLPPGLVLSAENLDDEMPTINVDVAANQQSDRSANSGMAGSGTGVGGGSGLVLDDQEVIQDSVRKCGSDAAIDSDNFWIFQKCMNY